MPMVAVVGYPNAGKSTLVNRLTGSRKAVVDETPGVTRDRNEMPCDWNGREFVLVDTGGVDAADPSHMQSQVADQARQAVEEADLVLLVIDARAGLVAGDEELADILRRSRRPVLVLANKVDDTAHEAGALELHGLGLGDPISVSALHGRGTGDLLDAIVERLPPPEVEAEEGEGAEADDEIRVAILGRPNVGKSSLVNAILGRPRVIVAPTPGTTRDAIDTIFERGERRFRLIDTAGLRRKRRHRQGIEYWSEVRALEAAAAGGHRARPGRLLRGPRRGRPVGGRRGAQGRLRHAGRPLEVGHHDGRGGRCRRAARRQAPPAARDRRRPPR